MLQAKHLVFRHPGASRQFDLSFVANPGEITAISGQSGSGKSTLLDLVAGFLVPSSGQLTLAGCDLLPLPPEAQVVSKSAGPNAMQITFQSKLSEEYVANYYRTILVRGGWSLESDATDAEGATAMYLVKDKRPMWIRIYRTPGAPGSMIEISGAVVVADSAKPAGGPPAPPPSGS